MATRMSGLFGRTLREAPAEAETANHQLLLRAGLVVQLAAGVYSYMPLAWRSLRKIETIIRDEMDRAGAQELLMPAIQPVELWQESGRLDAFGETMFRFRDRRDREQLLAPTHEEAVTDLFRNTVQSYRDLPQRVYQIQNKFRDEARPRGGLIRVRQFLMKDAYSFDADEPAFQDSYDAMAQAYVNVFQRAGVPITRVQADSGAIGGKSSHEFMFLTAIGEDTIALCRNCDYAANQERAEFGRGLAPVEEPAALEPVETPGLTTIDALAHFLEIPASRTAKAGMFLADGRPVFAVIRGDLDFNELKIANTVDAHEIRAMTNDEISAQGWVAGYASPIGLDAKLTDATVVADISIPNAPNLVAGGNRTDLHLRHTNYGRDWQAAHVADIGLARDGDPCPTQPDGTPCPGAIALDRGIELGHIFRLGTVFSEPLSAHFTDADGEQQLPIMGSYGIGVERLLAAVIEQNHDDQGIIWPAAVAPYDVHIVVIGFDKPEIAAAVAQTEAALEAAGLSVLTDDRDERPGVKFNDADLLGMPVRLTLSPRNLKADVVELKARTAAEADTVATAGLLARLADILHTPQPSDAPAS
ncbi:MAG: prolyl-tRNA synthetase [Chloroflexi bacterium]|nr:MAG: prolyl-tRNA synthetase [Chloroflexota bacterium]